MNSILRWQRPGLGTWTDCGQLSDLREEIDRLFETPLAALARGSQLLSAWTPAVDVYEDKENVYVKAELPGMKKEEIEVTLHEGTLSLTGERKVQSKVNTTEVYRAERFFGRFQRTVSLPSAVATEKVKAQYTDGILTITLPKTEEAKPKQIDVNVS